MNRITSAAVVVAALAGLAGCSTPKISASQLERVAKDWSLGVRASQVIPVYPLTEDLQPGDVFLVQTPSEDQVKIYLDKGFLPLENLVTRLPVSGYRDFYRGWRGVDDDNAPLPPRGWQFPGDDAAADYARAPLAAFPSYGFSVSRSTGLNVAIPVQSVPVGLNLLDSASADGTITLKDAYTYALPARSLYDAVHAWAKDNRDYLQQYAPVPSADGKSPPRPFYLRVVNRVYLVKTVNVSLFANRGTAADVAAGAPGKVELLDIGNATEATQRFEEVNKVLASAASAAAMAASPIPVGGNLRVAMATAHAVSLVETFARPLAIGYLATDFAIGDDGSLRAATPTMERLEGRAVLPAKAIAYTGCDENCGRLQRWLQADKPGNTARFTAWLEQQPDAVAIADLLTGPYPGLRERAAKALLSSR